MIDYSILKRIAVPDENQDLLQQQLSDSGRYDDVDWSLGGSGLDIAFLGNYSYEEAEAIAKEGETLEGYPITNRWVRHFENNTEVIDEWL